jgi:hypothetical protein
MMKGNITMTKQSVREKLALSIAMIFLALAAFNTSVMAEVVGPDIVCDDFDMILVAEFNFQGNEETGSYVFKKPIGNEGAVMITTGSEFSGEWTSELPIGLMIIKGTGYARTMPLGGMQAGEFSNERLDGTPNPIQPGIRKVTFCDGSIIDGVNNADALLVEGLNINYNKNNQLEWSTENEIENAEFRVWELAGTIASKSENGAGAYYKEKDIQSPHSSNKIHVIQSIDVAGESIFHILGQDGNTYQYKLVPIEE